MQTEVKKKKKKKIPIKVSEEQRYTDEMGDMTKIFYHDMNNLVSQ